MLLEETVGRVKRCKKAAVPQRGGNLLAHHCVERKPYSSQGPGHVFPSAAVSIRYMTAHTTVGCR